MIIVPLNHGFVAWVDDEDYPLVSSFKWRAINNNRRSAYGHWLAVARQPGPSGKVVMMHRLILNPLDGEQVDHINHLWPEQLVIDNRRCNLRLATSQQNNRNMRKRKRASSRFKGVSFDKVNKKWIAVITVDRQFRNLGRYSLEEDAARAYDRAAREAFGSFARLNFETVDSLYID